MISRFRLWFDFMSFRSIGFISISEFIFYPGEVNWHWGYMREGRGALHHFLRATLVWLPLSQHPVLVGLEKGTDRVRRGTCRNCNIVIFSTPSFFRGEQETSIYLVHVFSLPLWQDLLQKLRVDSPNKRVYNHENAKADPGPKNSTSPGPPPPVSNSWIRHWNEANK